uniref:Porin n=1 Tax=mine drainage metagenome TaxID=410659 RepID=E6Q0F4_9ZZZZ
MVQFYLQGGAYNIPALGTPFLSTRDTVSNFFGALPQGYIKLAPKGSFSYLAGKLPTLIGAEDTFSFENMNIERGILWNQENAVNRGLQVSYSKGKLSGALSWNDGFYSNRYNWISGMLTYTPSAANSIEVVGAGNYGTTDYSSVATPLFQNNSLIYNIIYTHTGKKLVLESYAQLTSVPENARIHVGHTTSTIGGAVLGTYNFTPHVSLAARGEYLDSTGNASNGYVNLLYGTGSNAWSMTLTPTYQNKGFFARAEFSFVQAMNTTSGDVFGATGTNTTQVRGMIESGFMF